MNDAENPPSPIASPTVHAHRLFVRGLVVSVLYVTGMGAYAWCMREGMLNMKVDEFATFLSGVFAPLAFLWLVLGFRQQGDELQNSARALWLQGEELRNSVEQQRQLVEVSREQLASEMADRLRIEEEAERTAQPQLVAVVGGSYSGPARNLHFYVTSAGPACTDFRVYLDSAEMRRGPILNESTKVDFQISYASPDEVQPCSIAVEYTDLRGNRRAQRFLVPVDETGGPNRDRTLGEPVKIGGVEKRTSPANPE